jgi:hypothetical protein
MDPPKKVPAAAGVKHKRIKSLDEASLGIAEEVKRRKDGRGDDEGGGDATASLALPTTI